MISWWRGCLREEAYRHPLQPCGWKVGACLFSPRSLGRSGLSVRGERFGKIAWLAATGSKITCQPMVFGQGRGEHGEDFKRWERGEKKKGKKKNWLGGGQSSQSKPRRIMRHEAGWVAWFDVPGPGSDGFVLPFTSAPSPQSFASCPASRLRPPLITWPVSSSFISHPTSTTSGQSQRVDGPRGENHDWGAT